jgi:7-cyano-7-deazaguanine synthase
MATAPRASLAVLISGGLDSAILLGEELRRGTTVFPIYVRFGLHYEEVELSYLERFLRTVASRLGATHPGPLQILDMPVADLYGNHWSITGQNVPGLDTPDEAVFLPGRNVLLLSKGMLWCHLHGIPALALGSLRTNPFPDATPVFFAGFEKLFNSAVGSSVQVRLPFANLGKTEVLRRGRDLPLEHTFSCIRPVDGLHCGRCNKCGERRGAFAAAEMPDPTHYALG